MLFVSGVKLFVLYLHIYLYFIYTCVSFSAPFSSPAPLQNAFLGGHGSPAPLQPTLGFPGRPPLQPALRCSINMRIGKQLEKSEKISIYL